MYYFGNSIAIKNIAFLIFYAQRFKCELIHANTCISFAKSWFSHTYLLAREQCLLSDIHILKNKKCKIPSAAPTINNNSLRFSHYYRFENFIT